MTALYRDGFWERNVVLDTGGPICAEFLPQCFTDGDCEGSCRAGKCQPPPDCAGFSTQGACLAHAECQICQGGPARPLSPNPDAPVSCVPAGKCNLR